jgi:hypothetical protein
VQSAIIAYINIQNSFQRWHAKPAITNFIKFAFTNGSHPLTKQNVLAAVQNSGELII